MAHKQGNINKKSTYFIDDEEARAKEIWWWKKGFQLASEFMLPFRACLRRLRDCLLNFAEFRQSSHDFGFLFAISQAKTSLATVSVTLRQWTQVESSYNIVTLMRRRVCLLERIVRSQRQASLQLLVKRWNPSNWITFPTCTPGRRESLISARRSLRNYKTCKNTFLGFSLAFPRPQIRFPCAENFLEREKVALPRFRMKLSGNLNRRGEGAGLLDVSRSKVKSEMTSEGTGGNYIISL